MDTYSISFAGSDARVDCRADQSLLDAVLCSGVCIPNSCNQGTCGTCRLRVSDGRVDQRTAPLSTLSQPERDEGWVLACQAVPVSDVVLEPAAGSAPLGPVHRLRDLWTTIAAVEDVALDVRRLVLAPDEPLDFTAGQHVEITVPGTTEARLYSLANAPDGSGLLEFHVRREPGGLASDSWVFKDAAIGQRVQVQGPLGDLRWHDDDDGPVVLLAGGTGLAPLLSMLRCPASRTGRSRSTTASAPSSTCTPSPSSTSCTTSTPASAGCRARTTARKGPAPPTSATTATRPSTSSKARSRCSSATR